MYVQRQPGQLRGPHWVYPETVLSVSHVDLTKDQESRAGPRMSCGLRCSRPSLWRPGRSFLRPTQEVPWKARGLGAAAAPADGLEPSYFLTLDIAASNVPESGDGSEAGFTHGVSHSLI